MKETTLGKMSIIPTNFAVCKKIGSVLVGKDWFLWQGFGTFQEEKAYFRGSRPILKAQVMGNLFFKFLEDISLSCGVTDTPVLNFWWCLFWVSKPEWIALFAFGRGVYYMFPEIHLWCKTCRPLGYQYGSWVILFLIPVSRHWWGLKPGPIVPLFTVWDQADALPTELCRLGYDGESSISQVCLISEARFVLCLKYNLVSEIQDVI